MDRPCRLQLDLGASQLPTALDGSPCQQHIFLKIDLVNIVILGLCGEWGLIQE